MTDEWIIFCFDPLPSSIFLWIIMNLGTCFVCIFGSYFIYLIWTEMESAIILLKPICTVIGICFMSATTLMSVHVTSSFYCIYGFQIWLNQGLSALFFNQLGISLLYLLFTIRLTYPFKGTALQPSKLLFCIFIFGFLMMLIFASLVLIIFEAAPMEQWYWAYDALISFQATNLLFTIILLSVFVKKMLLLNDITLLQKVIKLIICASMSLLSSQLPSLISFIRTINGENEIVYVTHVMLLVLDQGINLFSIYLQFPFGTKIYEIMCGKLAKLYSKHVINIYNLKSEIEMESHPTSASCNSTKSPNTNNEKITTSSSTSVTNEVSI